ncbi:MAG: SurA N-terminal domain-containing protein [Colwellia sp.]|nr:SurA N-terminal domain-containing protein [Colwellia sp.]
MLEQIREKSQGGIAKSILGLVILTFAVAGIGSYSNSVDTSVAEVNGQKITKNAFDKAYQNQRGRMEQQFGQMFETLSADSAYMANFRNGVLDNLINETLIDQSTSDLAIRISDERLKTVIREMSEFQVDGVFDNNRYLAIINQAGFFQSSDFRDYLRVEMTRRQLSQGLVGSEFNLPYQEELFNSLQNQKRDIRFATISAEQFKASSEVSDEEINSYYLANQTRFENKEQVKVDYLILDVNEIAKGIEVSDADLETYYQDNIDNYRQDEQRRVSHILIEFGDDESAAKASIQAILQRINKGEDFALLAKELSTDTFSGENGGDLDWIESGVMEPAFDESAFALTGVGSVSEIVKSEFGFHIIKLTDLKAEQTKALVDIRDELKDKVSNEKAQDRYFELQQEMAQISFEFPDSLDDAAQAVNISVQTSDWLSRNGNTLPFNNPQVVDAVFSALVLNDNVNSDVIEVNDSLAIVIRLNEHQPAEVKPLAEVNEQIKTVLLADKATAKALNTAEDLLSQFTAGTDITAALSAVNSSFVVKPAVGRFGSDVQQSVAKEAFVLPHPSEGNISASTVTLANGDLVLLEVQAIVAADSTEAVNPNITNQQVSQLAQSAYSSYIGALRVGAKITRSAINETVTAY